MLVVGLTGGIGSGKSLAAERFAELGVPVLDADRIGRELVAPGREALAAIVKAFGPQVLRPDGSLDRARLRRLAFADPEARRRLEAILHPRIRREMERRLQRLREAEPPPPYVVLVIPLLLEAGQRDLVDRVLVVDAPLSLQKERVRRRDGLDEATLEAILAAQLDRESRLAAADEVLENTGTPEALRRAVDALHRRYLALAAGAEGGTEP
ncbi:MAG: dephospho-CoA kinase [Gammaproteobacteria bacterium]|nr:MAG: dephospho-CoA kinase [Gammaproteobacteria bacterium]